MSKFTVVEQYREAFFSMCYFPTNSTINGQLEFLGF